MGVASVNRIYCPTLLLIGRTSLHTLENDLRRQILNQDQSSTGSCTKPKCSKIEEVTEHEDERLTIILRDSVVVAKWKCPAPEPVRMRRSFGKRALGGVGVHVAKAALTWERSK